IGAPSPWAEPEDRRLIPRYPIALVDDVPLLVVGGYSGGGLPEPVASHVEYYRKQGRIRAAPLVPTDRPLAVLDHLPDALGKYFADPKWADWKDDLLRDQLSRLIYSVYRKKGLSITEDGVSRAGYSRGAPPWAKASADVGKLDIRWDARNAKYTFRDGSTLPPPPRYPRIVWEVKEFDTEATLTIERQDEDAVNISLMEPTVKGPPVPQPSLRVYRVKDKGAALVEFPDVGERGDGGGGALRSRRGVRLPDGEDVRVEVTLGKESVTSPVYRP
ncbi:MAG TPA: hypothetical protein VFW33_20570, partial [Gemmataceae bacterium]|nr:hypothetical protein [Gemmataceae bacterium]